MPPERKSFEMAMVRVSPLPVDVRCGWLDGRPRSVRFAGETLRVVEVSRVRREVAAYPRAIGPRTLFEIVTPSARLQLGFRHRDHRWSLEGIDPDGPEIARAA
jgi:hypothetical protein